MAEENTSSTKPTTRPGRSWTITLVDTGETFIGELGNGEACITRRYNPERGQTEYPERAEAIGEVFAWLADHFDQAE